jgi:hypothetical protein
MVSNTQTERLRKGEKGSRTLMSSPEMQTLKQRT